MAVTTTYRLQLRDGMDFDGVSARVRYLADLGVSHLYLSPIFTAASGSTHGYDITDPAAIDPVLGGRDGFERLAAAAQAAGLGLILDIVPNHTAFHVENVWLRDVLRHGQASARAPFFDINWARGRLVLPWLPAPFEEALANGALRIEEGVDGPVLTDGAVFAPLAPGTAPAPTHWGDPDAIRATHDAQAWRLAHWEIERDGVTHRRFFTVSGLIGMRVEDPQVFEAMHALPLALLREGLAQGLRVDHVDGLKDPRDYLRRLRGAAGDAPIWVEKILTGDETLPDWPVEGTTGYEAGRAIARVLTDPWGLERLDWLWRAKTGEAAAFDAGLEEAKRDVLRLELAAELHQLIALARAAADAAAEIEAGDEALREAVMALLVAFPRYRTYFAEGRARNEDRTLMAATADAAALRLRTDRILRFVAALVTDAATLEAVAFRDRFQQVTGALLAKAHEDTAAFRHTRFLAANEVGAEPDAATLNAAGLHAWLAVRGPDGLTLTSSHDTKRSEDARARLIALSHDPQSFQQLWSAAPAPETVPAALRWYVLQSLLAIWTPDDPALGDRLAEHVLKAMREAKQATNWSHPDPEPEGEACDFARSLAGQWGAHPPEPAVRLIARGEALALCQVALRMLIPGTPDIYQGCEGPVLALTDPDNRRPVDWEALARLGDAGGFAGAKARLTATLARLRRRAPAFFREARSSFRAAGRGGAELLRTDGSTTLRLRLRLGGGDAGSGSIWPTDPRDRGACVAIDGDAQLCADRAQEAADAHP